MMWIDTLFVFSIGILSGALFRRGCGSFSSGIVAWMKD